MDGGEMTDADRGQREMIGTTDNVNYFTLAALLPSHYTPGEISEIDVSPSRPFEKAVARTPGNKRTHGGRRETVPVKGLSTITSGTRPGPAEPVRSPRPFVTEESVC